MKTCTIVIAACLAAGGAAAAQTSSPGQDQVLTRISRETGVSVHTLRKQEARTGLGYGNLEKANLLAKASGHSFRQVVSRFKAGEGLGEIAHDSGLSLGKIVSEAHRSDNAAQHARDERARDEKGHAQNVAAAQGHHRVLTKISNQTGVPVRALRKQEARTGLGFGALEKANLLAKDTGRSFRRVVSEAHRSDNAAQNAHKTHPENAHGKSVVAHGNDSLQRASAVSHGSGHMGTMNGFGHSGFAPVSGGAVHGMGHGPGGR